MQSGPVEGAVGDAFAREFRAVADADDDRASLAQPRDTDRVLWSHMIGVEARALRDAAAAHPDVVLHHQGHAGERQVLAILDALANIARFAACRFGLEANERVQRRISCLDAGDEGLGHIDGVELGRRHSSSDLTGVHMQHQMNSSKLRTTHATAVWWVSTGPNDMRPILPDRGVTAQQQRGHVRPRCEPSVIKKYLLWCFASCH